MGKSALHCRLRLLLASKQAREWLLSEGNEQEANGLSEFMKLRPVICRLPCSKKGAAQEPHSTHQDADSKIQRCLPSDHMITHGRQTVRRQEDDGRIRAMDQYGASTPPPGGRAAVACAALAAVTPVVLGQRPARWNSDETQPVSAVHRDRVKDVPPASVRNADSVVHRTTCCPHVEGLLPIPGQAIRLHWRSPDPRLFPVLTEGVLLNSGCFIKKHPGARP